MQVQEVLDPEDQEKRCDLLLALGDALIQSGESRRVLDEVAPEAFSLAETMGDGIRASQACNLAIEGLASQSGPQGFGTSEAAQWAERADRYAPADTVERAWADMSLGTARFITGDRGKGYLLLSRALDLARRLDDSDTFVWVAVFWLFLVTAPQHGEHQTQTSRALKDTFR